MPKSLQDNLVQHADKIPGYKTTPETISSCRYPWVAMTDSDMTDCDFQSMSYRCGCLTKCASPMLDEGGQGNYGKAATGGCTGNFGKPGQGGKGKDGKGGPNGE